MLQGPLLHELSSADEG